MAMALLAIRRGLHSVAGIVEDDLEELAHADLVIDDEDLVLVGQLHCSLVVRGGQRTVMLVPPPRPRGHLDGAVVRGDKSHADGQPMPTPCSFSV
jgi:hypothetical protein